MNPHLIARLQGIQQALLAQHLGGLGLPNAVVGSERETLLREFLQKVFPSHFRFASGAITDAEGRLSGQVDIAIEYPFIPSFPMPGSNDRLILAESVLAAIEVKSHLISQWDQVGETVLKVKQLTRQLNPLMRFGGAIPQTIPCIAIGYDGHTTNDGLRQRLASTLPERRPDAALVIRSGCYEGYGLSANGAVGLYALCISLIQLATQLQAAAPNLAAYVIPPKV
jgi:hypothetical protein